MFNWNVKNKATSYYILTRLHIILTNIRAKLTNPKLFNDILNDDEPLKAKYKLLNSIAYVWITSIKLYTLHFLPKFIVYITIIAAVLIWSIQAPLTLLGWWYLCCHLQNAIRKMVNLTKFWIPQCYVLNHVL